MSPSCDNAVIDHVSNDPGTIGSGLNCLAIFMRFHGLAADPGKPGTCRGTLRSHVFSHTANRIEVEPGARLFRHPLASPLGYCGAHRFGDSVARAREVNAIRQFPPMTHDTLVKAV